MPPGNPDRRPILPLAALFYGGCAVAALLWGALSGRPLLQLWPVPWPDALLGAAAGLGLGLMVVGLSRLLLRFTVWGRALFDWFAEVLGPISGRQALLLATLSAFGEELFFRGAMQPTLGLWITSAIFALLHFPQQLRLWPWTLSAGLMGSGFGLITLRSGHLGGAIIAHLVINWLNLAEVGRHARQRRAAEKLPGLDGTPSIDSHGESQTQSPPE